MTDRDRLIELLKQINFDFEEECVTCIENGYKVQPMLEEFFADYLLANGVIVPHCKVGDTIYEINTKYPKAPFINRFIVSAFHITTGKNVLGHKKPSHAVVGVDYMPSLTKRVYLENFGKTVFLTKEEAEEKLRELSNDGCK